MRQVSSLLSYWLYFPLAVAELSQPLAWWFWARGNSVRERMGAVDCFRVTRAS